VGECKVLMQPTSRANCDTSEFGEYWQKNPSTIFWSALI